MRNIPQSILDKIAQTQGLEPINIVRVFWTDNGYIDYADRSFDAVRGNLLTLSDIEDVINVDHSSSSTSVSVTLDDSDGSLKEIFNNTDIHRKHVQVLQWFADVPVTDAFVIFEGEIASPVTWSEAERTLSFDILSKLEDREVGFSAEEGEFNYVPPDIIGKAWPLVFGTVNGIPAVKVNKIPTGLTGTDLGVTDKSTKDKQRQLNDANMIDLSGLFRLAINTALVCYAASHSFEDQQFRDNSSGFDSDYSQEIKYWEQQGDHYTQLANQYLSEYNKLVEDNTKLLSQQQKEDVLKRNSIPVAGSDKFPQKATAIVKIGDQFYQGYFDAGNFNITQHPNPFNDNFVPAGITTINQREVVTEYVTTLPPQRQVFLQAGSDIRIGGDYPITYIAALNAVTVLGVSARRNGLLTGVPPNYYQVQQKQFGGIIGTLLVFPQPLSTIDSGWEDDIFVNMQSSIGPSPVDIMTYLIQTYTPYDYDPGSFGQVRTYIDRYPINFALTRRKNVFELLKDIAFQSRCALWFKDRKFYIKYLPAEVDSVETFTEDDIDVGSLQVSYTSTEDVITKFVALWKPDQSQDDFDKIIYRNNVAKYGTIEEQYEFYCYNNQLEVEKSAEFWSIRRSNVFKRISFRAYLTKLKVETWDTILLDFSNSYVCNGPVKAIVESSKLDTDNKKIIISAWVPVRAGEMTQFVYAWPANLPVEYVYPNPTDTNTGSPANPNATGDIIDQNKITPGQVVVTKPRLDRGRHRPIGDAHDNTSDFNVTTSLDSREITTNGKPTLAEQVLKQLQIKGLPDLGTLNTDTNNQTFFGFVDKHLDGFRYNVRLFVDGINQPAKIVVAEQFSIRDDEIIPPDTPAVVVKQTFQRVDNTGLIPKTTIERKYVMQVPVWVKPQAPPSDADTTGGGGGGGGGGEDIEPGVDF
jgi:hypothetical protein